MLRQTKLATLHQRADLACQLQDELRGLERDLAAVMGRTSTFYGKLIAARTESALSEIVGHDVLVSLSAANQGVTEGMSHVIAAHARLRQLAPRLGVEVAVGDVEDSGEITRPKAVLHVAA